MPDTIVHRLFEQSRRRPEAPAYCVRQTGIWHATSYADYAEQVASAARAFIKLGFEAGARTAILGFNRPEWTIFDIATMAAGGAPAGIYTTCSADEIEYILNHSESPFCLVETKEQWERIHAKRDSLSHLKHVITMQGCEVDDPLCMSWREFLALGADAEVVAEGQETSLGEQLQSRLDGLEKPQVATLIYTSGTTGPPKAVMLSHGNLAWTARVLAQLTNMEPGGRSLSYLPLSHIAEQLATIHGPITVGSTVYFAESIDAVKDNLVEVRPSLFFGVPRIWEKFYSAISGKVGQATGGKKRLVDWARATGKRVNELRNRGDEPTGLLAVQYMLAKKLVFDKLKTAVGLNQAQTLITGAAPLSQEIIEFFASFDMSIQEVYGQSEGSGPTSFNLHGRTKYGTVGPPIPGVEVKIAKEDGEILVRGPNVFSGYFKNEEATNDTLEGEWLHSGDLGRIDNDGFLIITGRKKDIIITAGGKNITPKNIESGIKNNPLVHEATVIGDRRKYLTALISPDAEAIEAFMNERGLRESPHESQQVRDLIQATVDSVNAKFARVEQIKKFAILPRPLSIEDGELTPTLKVKRNKVNEHFADLIDSLYLE